MESKKTPFSNNNWVGSFGNYYGNNQNPMKMEGSSTAAPIRMSGSSSAADPTSQLINILGGGLSSSITGLQESIAEIKSENTKSNSEIKEKLEKIGNKNWVEKLLNPATLAVIGIVILLVICIVAGLLKKYTGVQLSELRDYIFLFGGGLVGFIGGEKIKKD